MVRNKLGAAFLLGVCVSLLWGCSGAADESGGDVVDEINESMVSGISAESEEEVDLEVKKAEQKVREAGQEAKEAEQKVREAGQEAKEAEQEVREAVQELKKVDGNGKSFAGLPDEVIYSRPGTLLSSVGHDVYDPDTGESTPQDNGVYSFDAEFFDVDNMYTDFLLGVSRLGEGELDFTNIQENTEGMNWEEGTGTRTVSFDWKGHTYTLEAEVMYDWFDTKITGKLNEIVKAQNTGKQLFFATDGYQECIVLYATKERADLFGERTGFPLFESL